MFCANPLLQKDIRSDTNYIFKLLNCKWQPGLWQPV